jgi:hypothetical protein
MKNQGIEKLWDFFHGNIGKCQKSWKEGHTMTKKARMNEKRNSLGFVFRKHEKCQRGAK